MGAEWTDAEWDDLLDFIADNYFELHDYREDTVAHLRTLVLPRREAE